jgi:hypothetical protein
LLLKTQSKQNGTGTAVRCDYDCDCDQMLKNNLIRFFKESCFDICLGTSYVM